jgi:two-component system capsular synthesis response regulator RcsB
MSTSKPLRLLILDDHAVVRLGYEHAIAMDPGLRVVASFARSKELLAALWEGIEADILLLDYSLGNDEIDGINLIAMLRAKRPLLRILVASAHEGPAIISLVVRAGAHGFLGKAQAMDELLPAIRQVAAGKTYLPTSPSGRLLEVPGEPGVAYRPEDGMDSVFQRLSPREHDVLRCLMQGMTITGIATKFSRSVKTVSNQKQSAFKKLGVSTVAELISVRHKVEGT